MFDLTTIASGTIILTFIGTIAGYVARLWYNHRKLTERVETLEKEGFMSEKVHLKEQQICRAEVYKDISALESAIARVEGRLDRGEVARDEARKEDVQWKEEMAKQLAEIGALLKNEMYHHRMQKQNEQFVV